MKRKFNARDRAKYFEETIWRYHARPNFQDHLPANFGDIMRIPPYETKCFHFLSSSNRRSDEKKNDWIISALYHFVSLGQDNWDKYSNTESTIPSTHSSTGHTPFCLEYGRHSKSLLDLSFSPFPTSSIFLRLFLSSPAILHAPCWTRYRSRLAIASMMIQRTPLPKKSLSNGKTTILVSTTSRFRLSPTFNINWTKRIPPFRSRSAQCDACTRHP